MIVGDAEPTLQQLAKGYPILALTGAGPRQPAKTTLARALFPGHPCVTRENPAQREFAQTDPQGFLQNYADGAVIDEAQRCPDLFAWLQGVVDQARRPAHFILTASQQFGPHPGITQSLAGRVALRHLLPFSANELRPASLLPNCSTRRFAPGVIRYRVHGKKCRRLPTNYPSSHVSQAQHGGQGRPARHPGSAAFDLAWLAAGRTDGFFEIGLNPWDIAAGALLIKEAGGLVTDFAGEDNYLESGHIVAGSPKIFAQLLQAIAPHVTPELKG